MARYWISVFIISVMMSSCAHLPRTEVTSAPAPVMKTPDPVPQPSFSVQVAAFSRKEKAEGYIDRLQSGDDIPAYTVKNAQGLWTVRTGSFTTGEEARQHASALQSSEIIDDYLVVTTPPPRPSEPDNTPTTLRDSIVTTATGFLGTPYAWGSTSPDKGLDCSGFTMVVFRRHGFDLPRSAAGQFRVGEPVPRNALEKGDLLFFATGRKDRISHVGIYSGNDSFIHASTQEASICTADLSKSYYQKRYKGARRVVPLR